jgi:FixJ family two-component response regulator
LLLDIHLGAISGIELQRRLAAWGSKWPVIFMTASDDEATRNQAMDAGCIAYFRKPLARMSCWMPFRKLWLSRRSQNKNARGRHIRLGSIALRIPIYSGQVFRREAGHRSDLKPATIPKW